MAERVKDNKKRGSRLGPRKASVVEDGQDGSKVFFVAPIRPLPRSVAHRLDCLIIGGH